MGPIQRLNAFGSIGFAVQQRLEIDPGEFREQVRKTDEAAEHAVAVEAVGEIGMARTPDDVTLVHVSARHRHPASVAAARDRARSWSARRPRRRTARIRRSWKMP